MHRMLPHHLCMNLLMWLFVFGLVGSFVLLAQAYGDSQPLLMLVVPIPIASALMVLIVVHDRRALEA